MQLRKLQFKTICLILKLEILDIPTVFPSLAINVSNQKMFQKCCLALKLHSRLDYLVTIETATSNLILVIASSIIYIKICILVEHLKVMVTYSEVANDCKGE